MRNQASGGGSIQGQFVNHRAALASTERADHVALPDPSVTLHQVAEHPRGAGHAPYRVIHDATVNRPFGRYAVYIGQRRLGAQLSVPSAADCARMENPPAPRAALPAPLSNYARRALGLMSPEDRAERNRQQREWYASRRGARANTPAKS